MPLIKNEFRSLAKKVLIPLRLTGAVSATDAVIQKKFFWIGYEALTILNEEMDYIIKIVKSLEDAGLLIKGVSETIKNEAKEQRGGFFGMLLGTLGFNLLTLFRMCLFGTAPRLEGWGKKP